jgi:hypothetical protein
MYKCKNFIKKIGYNFCKKQNKKIVYSDCVNCTQFEKKTSKGYQHTKNNKCSPSSLKKGLNKVSKKRAKLERERYSVFTNDLTRCVECQKTKNDLHECIGGKNILNSMKHGLVVPLCRLCHDNKETLLKWKIKAQKYFVKKFGHDEFIKIFKIDYIEKMTQKKDRR